MTDELRIRVLSDRRASPDGVTVHTYQAGEIYGPDSDPPMPADLAAVFLCEGWGELADGAEAAPCVHAREAPAGPACLWCSEPYARRATGGRPQKYCCSTCRRACHAAARRWAVSELEAGRLSVANVLGRA